MKLEPRHQCLVYDGPPSHKLKIVSTILQRKLIEGYRCLYINSAPMVAGMCSTLAALGVDVASEIKKVNLILDSDSGLSCKEFIAEDMIAKLEITLNQALKDGYKGLWASGDMTFEFGPRKDFSKLLDYEMKLEKLFRKREELYGICQYHRDSLPKDAIRQGILVHPHIVINETLSIINLHYLESPWPADPILINKLDEMITGLSLT